MKDSSIDNELLEQLRHLAETAPTPLGNMSLDAIASALGITRMTLYRRAGTRDQIVRALDGVGVDARRQPDVFERVVAATTELLRERSIAELTLEMIAERAGCSVPAIHARFDGRQGVLIAVIQRHSPLFPMKQLVSTELDSDREDIDLRHDVRRIYTTLYNQVSREWRVLRSFIAEALRDPGSDVGDALRNWYLPQVSAIMLPLIQTHIKHGTMRDLPVPIIIQVLVAPMGLHIASRNAVEREFDTALPDPETTVELFTEMFCRAVGTHADAPSG